MSEPFGPLLVKLGRCARPPVWRVLLALLVAGCGGHVATVSAARESAAASDHLAEPAVRAAKGGLVTSVTPSLLLPDLVGERGVVGLEDGHKRVLIDRMRIIAHEDGSLERAADLLPSGQVTAVKLPSRLGGGYVFYAASRSRVQLWRAPSWLAKLSPLVQLSVEATEVVPGFDRLYVRLSQSNRLIALDAQTGAAMPLGPLPPASAYGQMVFADGWRAAVEADLRGLLVTFDAGATWRSVDIDGRPNALAVIGGDPAVIMGDGFYTIDARGGVTFRALDGPEDAQEPPAHAQGLFGRRPLRTAVEDGWPDSATTAVVARGGSLARVSLRDGAVLDVSVDAYAERQAACHAVRLGASFGFVCGEREGTTALYAFQPPLRMRAVLRFDKPRFVASSDNGALVVRGPCGDTSSVLDSRVYCVVAVDGTTHEVHVKSAESRDIGMERVVALSDGRVAILIPPRIDASGQITLLKGAAMTTVPLTMPAQPRSTVRHLQRGMWLEGFQEREPGVLGGWVEAGGPTLGVRIDVKSGKVTAGEARRDGMNALLSGRFALSLGEGEHAAESTDGGMTWQSIDVPERDEDPAASPTRACGPVGCAFKGWIRVGWGHPAVLNDLAPAENPASLYSSLRSTVPVSMRCEVVGSSTPPLSEKAPLVVPTAPVRLGARRIQRESVGALWLPFRNTPPPALGAAEIGFDNGAPNDLVTMRVYAWGKKGADWARVGRWAIRFDDRFDPEGGVRTSATSASPWSDEAAAAEALGIPTYGATSWGTFLDPSGRAALAQACRGSGPGCSLFAVADGQPILPLRDSAGRMGLFLRPFPSGAVRLGETWFFVTPGSSYDAVTLWRADLGIARAIATWFRPARAGYVAEPLRLVRRALGGALGLLISMPPEPGLRAGTWYVLPIDRDTGALGEAIPLGRKDLSETTLERCNPGQDGWLLDTALEGPPEGSPSLDVGGTGLSGDAPELRLHLDPGAACVEAMSVRLQGTFVRPPSAKPLDLSESGIPLAATERVSGLRWRMRCERRSGAGR